mmetsp:Transcript_48916/g.95940  ORF Transcript_48916/g.95940 Transcript_48916/m.95940 type:complete len:239 (+) Transcript_48916:718-1434(+)
MLPQARRTSTTQKLRLCSGIGLSAFLLLRLLLPSSLSLPLLFRPLHPLLAWELPLGWKMPHQEWMRTLTTSKRTKAKAGVGAQGAAGVGAGVEAEAEGGNAVKVGVEVEGATSTGSKAHTDGMERDGVAQVGAGAGVATAGAAAGTEGGASAGEGGGAAVGAAEDVGAETRRGAVQVDETGGTPEARETNRGGAAEATAAAGAKTGAEAAVGAEVGVAGRRGRLNVRIPSSYKKLQKP